MRILFDKALPATLRDDVETCLRRAGVDAAVGDPSATVRSERVDAIVTPSASLFAVVEQLNSNGGDVPIVVLDLLSDPEQGRTLLSQGASGVVEPLAGPTVIAACIVACTAGATVLPRQVTEALLQRLEPLPDLSASELAFVSAMATHSVKDSAKTAGFSERNGERHHRRLLRRHNLRNHWELAAAAGRWGLWRRLEHPS